PHYCEEPRNSRLGLSSRCIRQPDGDQETACGFVFGKERDGTRLPCAPVSRRQGESCNWCASLATGTGAETESNTSTCGLARVLHRAIPPLRMADRRGLSPTLAAIAYDGLRLRPPTGLHTTCF